MEQAVEAVEAVGAVAAVGAVKAAGAMAAAMAAAARGGDCEGGGAEGEPARVEHGILRRFPLSSDLTDRGGGANRSAAVQLIPRL